MTIPENEAAKAEKPKPPKSWKLNVQGVVIDLKSSSVTVEAAMREAGFDTTQEWIKILRIKGEPKRLVELTTVIDLTNPGVEKLRLTPKDISNGEAPLHRRDFELLDVDEAWLSRTGLWWETIIDNGVRWLVLRGYALPEGYTQTHVDLALQIPLTYPGSQIDMFYCYPPLALESGRALEAVQCTAVLCGVPYQRWSRHRPEGAWSRHTDNVSTHMTLVDASLHREVES